MNDWILPEKYLYSGDREVDQTNYGYSKRIHTLLELLLFVDIVYLQSEGSDRLR